LAQVLRHITQLTTGKSRVLVDFRSGDDAAVYKLTEDLALVTTVDFFPPIVDDPYTFGVIAAANALSDVYAMGGTPITALNIAAFPSDLPAEILGQVLAGGSDKAAEAGVSVVGGHTVDDQEPKYGMAVTGIIKPGDLVTLSGAQPSDRIVLTKPIGTGVITTAVKNGNIGPEALNVAVESMSLLNREASEAMLAVGVNACTDVTGFGLLGHLRNMVHASGVSARISRNAIPELPGTMELLDQEIAPGGTHRNFESANSYVNWADSISNRDQLFLSDAQTSGGLLIAVPADRELLLINRLIDNGVVAPSVIGEITEGDSSLIYVDS